ncbi:pectate lyase-like adhesive domain-containing protein [Brochothrix campestris]|uniref:Bacterial Ig domain-containing protein n=1 Tax=Brochothrix campestris FSL F6-1037 TaxID=1265861 RepID=W7CRQ3_9LIST|nr:pectate lyase-like adhesive domain-containing protein [Brochothrix campestris]EUJ35688.1 hypothetical protein BCAMP_11475 [Brochothrix campestris FSL F6-1037]
MVIIMIATLFVGETVTFASQIITSEPQTSASKEDTSASKEDTSASKEDTSASKEETSASKEETSASKEETSASKEETSASKEETSASKEETPKQKAKATRAGTAISTWEELRAAYADGTVTAVSLSNDITRTTGDLAAGRNTDFSIEGNGYNLDLGNQVFRVQQSATATFSISNIKTLSTTAGRVTGIVSSGDANTALSGWTINFTDVNSALDNQTRIASVSGGQLNLAGNITWYTATEMAVIDGVKIEDNAKVIGFKQTAHDDRSFFWFAQAGMREDSAGSHDFVIGKNATGSFKMTGSGVAFPVVFAYYNEIHLEEGATYNATMPGNAFRSDYYKSSFVADGKNKINITSLSSGQSPVSFNSNVKTGEDSRFYVGPESEFYIIGNTNSRLFDASIANDARRTTITIDTPKNYDLRNSSTATNANSSIANTNFKEFSIKNSDVNVWELKDQVLGPATYGGSKVDYVTRLANGTVTSSDSGLQSIFSVEGLRRISGLNQDPEFEFNDVTNAEYSISGKVILGYVPDENGMDDEGNFHYIPVYAGKDQGIVELKDSYSVLHPDLKTDETGEVKYTGDKLNLQDKVVTALSANGAHIQQEQSEYTVVDVTPPEPTELLTKRVSVNTTTLKGTGEVGATVYLELNGTLLSPVTTEVDADGNWSMEIPTGTFVKDMTGQLLLEDKAGKADIDSPPETNSDKGNINPREDLTYKDVTFKAGTKFVVENLAPEITIGAPVKDGETYEYYPENHAALGGIVEVVANVRDLDSETFTTYIEVDGGAPESLGIKPGGNELYRDVSREYTEEEIQEILADNEPHQFTMYATDSDGATSEKVSIMMIWPDKGELVMKSVPDVSFGNQEINTIDKSFYVESKSDDLIIEDTRKEVSSWKVNAQIEQELTNQDTNKVIPSVIRYDNQVISADKLTIFEKNDPTKGTFNLSEKWIEDQKGLNLFLPVGKISSGDYDASIIWSLEDTVANEN